MNVILVSSALDVRTEALSKAFQKKNFNPLNKWIGVKDWPDLSTELAGIIFLEDGRSQALETIIEARQKLRESQSIPLIVIPNDFGPKTRVKYITAGATQVCNPDETIERIVAEVKASFDLDSRETAQTRLELLQPFIAATIEALDVMVGKNVEVDQILRKTTYTMDGDITGIIYLTGKTERLLAVTFPEKAAKEISSKLLAEATQNPTTEMISDCVGEIVNVIAGQVKGRFVHTDYEFDISTPTLITGSNHEIRHRSDLPCYVMSFHGDLGHFSLQLCIRGAGGVKEETDK